MPTGDFLHDSFWVAAAAAAPVIGLAHFVLIGRNSGRLGRWSAELKRAADDWELASRAIEEGEDSFNLQKASANQLKERIAKALDRSDLPLGPEVQTEVEVTLDSKVSLAETNLQMHSLEAGYALVKLRTEESVMRSAIRWTRAVGWTAGASLCAMAVLLGVSMMALAGRTDTLPPDLIVCVLAVAMLVLMIAPYADAKANRGRLTESRKSRRVAKSVIRKASNPRIITSDLSSAILRIVETYVDKGRESGRGPAGENHG